MKKIIIISFLFVGCNSPKTDSSKEVFEENKINVQDTSKELLYSSYHIDSNFTWGPIKAPGIGNSVVITNKNFGIIEEIDNEYKYVKLYDTFDQLVHVQTYRDDSLIKEVGQSFTYWYGNYNKMLHTFDFYIASVSKDSMYRNLIIYTVDTTGKEVKYEQSHQFPIHSNKDTITIQLKDTSNNFILRPTLIYFKEGYTTFPTIINRIYGDIMFVDFDK